MRTLLLDGPVTTGDRISLGWPEPTEYDTITALRNRPSVRRCFLDSRPLDPAANRIWLERGMQRPQEGLLSIRLGTRRTLCGTIGWSGYDPALGTFEIGRLMVDATVVRSHRALLPAGYPGVAVDASRALLRYAFEHMRLAFVTSVLISGLALPRRVNLLAGGVIAGESERVRADGSRVRVTTFVLERERWQALQTQYAASLRVGAAA